ncbi:MAG: hypothetical protein U0840_23325 [Gemmataceae bacterium]
MTDTEPTLQDQIDELFQEAQAGTELVQDLAHDCLTHYRRDCRGILEWYRAEGRSQAAQGMTSALLRQRVDEQMQEARQRLYQRLKALLGWATEKQGGTGDPA